jgi:hypothetical protein
LHEAALLYSDLLSGFQLSVPDALIGEYTIAITARKVFGSKEEKAKPTI